jgi:hypothetical protein
MKLQYFCSIFLALMIHHGVVSAMVELIHGDGDVPLVSVIQRLFCFVGVSVPRNKRISKKNSRKLDRQVETELKQ